MNTDLNETLYTVPQKAHAYADSVFELDAQHIPVERIPLIKEVMLTAEHNYEAIMAARVLASWGVDDGLDFLACFVCCQEPPNENLMPHRTRGYDDTYTQILNAVVSYWVKNARHSDTLGAQARERILPVILRIVELSNHMPFQIDSFFWLLDEGFTEYLPALKVHLQSIIKNPMLHHAKVADCAHLVTKFDPDFVTQTLAAHGYTLADFANRQALAGWCSECRHHPRQSHPC